MTAYKGLTLEEIVECFIDPSNQVDSQLLNIFLYTYRNYCNSENVIILINERLKQLNNTRKFPESKQSEHEGFTKAVINFINSWLTFPFAFDFYELPDFKSINYLLKKIRIWPQKILFIKKSQDFKQSFQRLEEKINTVLVEFNNVEENIESNFRERPVDCSFGESFQINNLKENKLNCSFIDYSSEIIANCFTYLDQKVLKHLKLQEMLDHIRRKQAPSVTSVIDNYNKLYNVVSLTVNEPSLAWKRCDQYQYSGRNSPVTQENSIPIDSPLNIKRTEQVYQVIFKWIQIAQILNDMLNFSSLMAILTALDNPSNVSIMKKGSRLYNQYQSLMKTNEVHISQNKESKKLNLESSSNQSNSSNKSKGKLKNLKILHNEVPYLGKHLKNLTYIDDGFPDYLKPSAKIYNGNDERLINLDKCRRQFDVLVQVKMCISAFKSTTIQPDESFLNWYSEIQREHEKPEPRILLTGSTLSLESEKSDVSGSSNSSCTKVNQYFKPSLFQYHSHQNLMETTNRFRSQSSPVQAVKITNCKEILKPDSLNCKVATVKLKHSKYAENHDNNLYGSANYLHNSKGYKKHETISNGALHPKNRPKIINRSSSTVNTDCNDPHHLENILYKKIQINENEHTADFIVRVFEKFGIHCVDSSNFEVIQILENNKEIVIPENANVFYALAEQNQYLIDILPKRLKVSKTKL